MKICKTCNKEYDENLKFCSACGSLLEEVKEKETESKRVCIQCGKEYDEEVKFCSECGSLVELKKSHPTVLKNICSGCGKVYEEEVKFCGSCGNPVEKKEVRVDIHEENKEEKMQKKHISNHRRKGPIIAIASAALCIFILALLIVFDVISFGENDKNDMETMAQITEELATVHRKETTEKDTIEEKKTKEVKTEDVAV